MKNPIRDAYPADSARSLAFEHTGPALLNERIRISTEPGPAWWWTESWQAAMAHCISVVDRFLSDQAPAETTAQSSASSDSTMLLEERAARLSSLEKQLEILRSGRDTVRGFLEEQLNSARDQLLQVSRRYQKLEETYLRQFNELSGLRVELEQAKTDVVRVIAESKRNYEQWQAAIKSRP
jgi:hypothetical protein